MLKQRILTAAVLIPLVIFALFNLSSLSFLWVTGLVVLGLGGWEWSRLTGLAEWHEWALYLIVLTLVAAISYWQSSLGILGLSLGWWLLALGSLVYYARYPHSDWLKAPLVLGFAGVMTLVPCWLSLNLLRDLNPAVWQLLLVLLIIWVADTAAYFVGKRWGKRKLAATISPGKSWEGCLGALIVTQLFALWYGIAMGYRLPQIAGFMLLVAVTVIFSIVGDLFESVIKRLRGVKDSSQLLPGHGGILDRIDSLTAAAPIFYLGLMWWAKL